MRSIRVMIVRLDILMVYDMAARARARHGTLRTRKEIIQNRAHLTEYELLHEQRN